MRLTLRLSAFAIAVAVITAYSSQAAHVATAAEYTVSLTSENGCARVDLRYVVGPAEDATSEMWVELREVLVGASSDRLLYKEPIALEYASRSGAPDGTGDVLIGSTEFCGSYDGKILQAATSLSEDGRAARKSAMVYVTQPAVAAWPAPPPLGVSSLSDLAELDDSDNNNDNSSSKSSNSSNKGSKNQSSQKNSGGSGGGSRGQSSSSGSSNSGGGR
jgi:uncharacterized membrane protein YgcG